MKKILCTLIICLCCITLVCGQNFKPGQQAQGMLESKNVTVDYATGTFHYHVPVYTLKSGDYELPITLDYTARGVRVDDRPGLLGYNWTLNTGGVVTRTVRGGIADETMGNGFLWTEDSATPLHEDIGAVNQHKRDGECDIFTAVFGGRSVHFIIRKNKEDKIYADPLEFTNVRIECESNDGQHIDGWIITDESGNRYIYRQKEYVKEAINNTAISINSVKGIDYVSSWYISRIEPLNAQPILFTYYEDVDLLNIGEKVNETHHQERYEVTYKYGKAWYRRTFDMTPYLSDFRRYIQEAQSLLNTELIQQRVNNNLFEFTNEGKWIRNPFFEFSREYLEKYESVLGQMINLSKVCQASAELVQSLDYFIETYSADSSTKVQMAVISLCGARDLVLKALTDSEYVTEDVREFGCSYFVYSPLLQSIVSADKTLSFIYEGQHNSYKLSKITLQTKRNEDISSISVSSSILGFLNSVSFLDREEIAVSNMKFKYYEAADSVYSNEVDLWGYRAGNGMMKRIILSGGGSISLEYESNRVRGYTEKRDELFDYGMDYGGMRLRSLVMNESEHAIADTICYEYPVLSYPLHEDLYIEDLNYGTFKDYVYSARARNHNISYTVEGNNGVIYPYVLEKIKGKGCRAFYFCAPIDKPVIEYPYWAYGLPIGITIYDNSNNLIQIMKNNYYVPDSETSIMGTTLWRHVYKLKDLPAYNKKISQVHPYDFYIDAESISKYFQAQKDIHLYESITFSPYNEIFVPNISNRLSIIPPIQNYDFTYGGLILLKNREEYRFQDWKTDSIQYEDLATFCHGTPFKTTEYKYGNLPFSALPTEETFVNSQGKVYKRRIQRLMDMNMSTDSVFSKMSERNMQAQVIKETTYQDSITLNETVTLYSILKNKNKEFVLPTSEYMYIPNALIQKSVHSNDTSLFTYSKEHYILAKQFHYLPTMYGCLLVELDECSSKTSFCYNKEYEYVILKAMNANHEEIAASDMTNVKEEESETLSWFRELIIDCQFFYRSFNQIDFSIFPDETIQFMNREDLRRFVQLIEIIATENYPVVLSDFRTLVEYSIINADCWYDFLAFYKGLISAGIMKNITNECLENIRVGLTMPLDHVLNICNYAYSEFYHATLEDVKIHPSCARLAVYVLGSATFSYQVVYKDGTIQYKTKSLQAIGVQLGVGIIELDNYESIDYIKVNTQYFRSSFWAIVPEGTEFEARLYNPDQTLHARFNEKAKLEIYEYDPAGRVTKVKDQNGFIMKEYQYNTKLN